MKVLTEISNYVLIGYFQILCNFYDENDDLFYTISLLTAMGSINKLSTIKSVFIVPFNKSMNKIKIDFFIMPKIEQENRSAKFLIYDINSNKIYIKYYQKTDEMSIKNIKDSLNTVNNISAILETIDENKENIASNLGKIDENKENIASNLEKIKELDNNIILKNIKNILFYNDKTQIDFKNNFYDKTFDLNIKKNNFIEIDLRILLDYKDIDYAHATITEFKLLNDNDDEIYTTSIENQRYISYSNYVFINKNIFYNFEKDTTKLKILIYFKMRKTFDIKIWYIPVNTDRLILKHYG